MLLRFLPFILFCFQRFIHVHKNNHCLLFCFLLVSRRFRVRVIASTFCVCAPHSGSHPQAQPARNESFLGHTFASLAPKSSHITHSPFVRPQPANTASCVAQRKRAGLITRRSLDRNESQLGFSFSCWTLLFPANKSCTHPPLVLYMCSPSAAVP